MSDYSITASATGVTSSLNLTPGEYVLQIRGTGTFTVDLQTGTTPKDVYWDPTTKVTLVNTGTPLDVLVPGGFYNMNVTALQASNTVTMTALQVTP